VRAEESSTRASRQTARRPGPQGGSRAIPYGGLCYGTPLRACPRWGRDLHAPECSKDVLPTRPRKREGVEPHPILSGRGGAPWVRGLPTPPRVGCDRARSPVRARGKVGSGVSPQNRSIPHPQHGSGGIPHQGPNRRRGRSQWTRHGGVWGPGKNMHVGAGWAVPPVVPPLGGKAKGGE